MASNHRVILVNSLLVIAISLRVIATNLLVIATSLRVIATGLLVIATGHRVVAKRVFVSEAIFVLLTICYSRAIASEAMQIGNADMNLLEPT